MQRFNKRTDDPTDSIHPEVLAVAEGLRDVLERWMHQQEGYGAKSTGLCIPAAIALCELLKRLGHEGKLVRGVVGEIGHAWVEFDHWIVDITSDQFKGRPNVTILAAPQDEYREVDERDNRKFSRDMSVAGDNGLMTYHDNDGEERPLGTTRQIADILLKNFEAMWSRK